MIGALNIYSYIPLIGSITPLILGILYFFSQWSYSEDGHVTILVIYAILCCSIFGALRFKKPILLFIIVSLFVGTFSYASQKFEWRKHYILSAQSGIFFEMDPYINSYPTFEDNLFGWIQGKPKWVKFNDECFKPALKNDNVGRNCKSASLILEYYNIDVKMIINDYFQKMRATAQLVVDGSLSDKASFQSCLSDKSCAMIPLLPKDVTINEQSDEYMDIRKQFWSLVNDEVMSNEICTFMDLCRAMRDSKIIMYK